MKKSTTDHLIALVVAGVIVQIFMFHYREWYEKKKIINV